MEERKSKPDHFKDEHVAYLEELRDNGSINMMGAAIYLQKRFFLTEEQAKAILFYWFDM